MNVIIEFFHHLFNPHCEYCADEVQDKNVCKTCEVLKQQLEVANQLNRDMLNRLTEKPSEPEITRNPNPTPIYPQHIPFRVKRQQLERQDRELAAERRRAAELSANAPKPVEVSKSNEELEREMGIVTEEEANQNAG